MRQWPPLLQMTMETEADAKRPQHYLLSSFYRIEFKRQKNAFQISMFTCFFRIYLLCNLYRVALAVFLKFIHFDFSSNTTADTDITRVLFYAEPHQKPPWSSSSFSPERVITGRLLFLMFLSRTGYQQYHLSFVLFVFFALVLSPWWWYLMVMMILYDDTIPLWLGGGRKDMLSPWPYKH